MEAAFKPHLQSAGWHEPTEVSAGTRESSLKVPFIKCLHFTSKGFISQGFSQPSRTTSAYDSVIFGTKCKRSLHYKSTWILLVAVRNLNATYRLVFCFIIKVALPFVCWSLLCTVPWSQHVKALLVLVSWHFQLTTARLLVWGRA